MWCPTQARPPLATQNVLLSSAPQASSGRPAATGSGVPAGTCPRDRRRTTVRAPARRTTLSSVRVWIARSWSRSRSAMPRSRARASSSRKAIGSSATLPLVMTSGSPTSPSSRWCSGEYGSITPRSGAPGATAAATAAPGCRGASTIGRARSASSAAVAASSATSAPAAATSGAISANGLSSRCLRARSAATADSSPARHARWKPPMPLTATIRPARSAAATAASGSPGTAAPSSAATSRSRGPQAGQAFGSAWKRRSAGSSYSAWQAAHMRNGAIVVRARSYGTPSTIVNRGPHPVQLVNG